MNDWWYADKGKKKGPVEIDELRRLFAAGKIGPETIVWQEGMPTWLPMGEVDALDTVKAALPPPLPSEPEVAPGDYPLAGPWVRFLARTFDVFLESLLIAVAFNLSVAYGPRVMNLLAWNNKPEGRLLLYVLWSLAVWALDATLYRAFGNTLGKALLGVAVTRLDGSRLGFARYLKRNMELWLRGYALGLPIVSLFTLALQYRRLSTGRQASYRGRQTSYDEVSDCLVHSQPRGPLRGIVMILSFAGLFLCVLAGSGVLIANAQSVAECNALNTEAAALYQRGNYGRAAVVAERGLDAAEQIILFSRRPAIALSLNSLALAYEAQGRYAEAEPLYKRSLAIQEKVLGLGHPDVATSLNNLAELYRAQSHYAQAEPLYERSLAILEKALGPDHPNVASSLNNLAGLYYNQDRYEQAEPLYKRSLVIREKVLGPNHPDVATSLNNLGFLYGAEGQYAQAEPLYERSLAIWEKALGPDHPNVAQSLENMAALYRKTGREKEAQGLEKRAAEIRAIRR